MAKNSLRIFLLVLILCSFSNARNTIIGKVDLIDLPDLKLENIKAKIDTGACTSSLHCSYINAIDNKTIEFKVLDDTHIKFRDKIIKLPLKRIAEVRSSNGAVEKRYVIETKVRLFDKLYKTAFTLRGRKKMEPPVLLGRKLLEQAFGVDVAKENLSLKQMDAADNTIYNF